MGKKGNKTKSTAHESRSASDYLLSNNVTPPEEDRHALYQQSVQSPKGDISYLIKFFLTYVGGRIPVHFREDFCGTALICSEWLRGDARRTAVGLDLDDGALRWGMKHNFESLQSRRMCFLHGNVLQELLQANSLENDTEAGAGALNWAETDIIEDTLHHSEQLPDLEEVKSGDNGSIAIVKSTGAENLDLKRKPADIVCAFNFSTCCLHTRQHLLTYLRNVRKGMNPRGSMFAMDLYGGTSSECALKLKRKFDKFTYTWEQEEFDILTRMTRISIHFKTANRTIKKAFSYQWRLWSLPELKECLTEAGFSSVHVWMREMPALLDRQEDEDDEPSSKYEESTKFLQCDAWNAYIVAKY